MKKTAQQRAEAGFREAGNQFDPILCPVRATMGVLGGKWKILLLSNLAPGPRRYGELKRLLPEITEKMLIQELRGLEVDGLVQRTVQYTVPPRVDYALTGPGIAIKPLLNELLAWGTNYIAFLDARKECLMTTEPVASL